MQDDSLEGRVMATNHMREMIYQNEQSLRRRTDSYSYRDHYHVKTDEEIPASSGTFSLRVFFSLVILVAFVWLHMQGSLIFGHNTEEVVEAVSQSTNLQELTDSVRINP